MIKQASIEKQMDTDTTEKNYVVRPMMIRSVKAGGFFRANESFRAKVGLGDKELSAEQFLHWIDPADLDLAKATLDGKQACCQVKHKTCCGNLLSLNIRVAKHEGDFVILAVSGDDAIPSGDFEGISSDPDDANDEATVSGTLHTIARIVEEQNPGYKCSILLVADGCFVRGAGPSLPEEYNAAIDGYAVGPTVGSCGTAIYWNAPVIVEDIQADPCGLPLLNWQQKQEWQLAGRIPLPARQEMCWEPWLCIRPSHEDLLRNS